MSFRRCATEGCPGTLPAGVGTHCPRCGGTEFIRKPRRARRVFLILLFVLIVTAGILILMNVTGTPKERQSLVDARDVAARMTDSTMRDTAFSDILHRALAAHDFEFACEVGNEMTGSAAKDKCLSETVEEALNAHETEWAKRAAGEIIDSKPRDEAFRKIMDAGTPK